MAKEREPSDRERWLSADELARRFPNLRTSLP